ncbi:MAG: hypothetical protein A3F91_12350 [Flavobacteria bacterium RIFCSPLOWO2_12_FULL_35_11]|nr:MAG: hypothetical protein A3F91_12350 [Flavobacteria bacterium RIFCSPLOWO2_12_FULL_35_11]
MATLVIKQQDKQTTSLLTLPNTYSVCINLVVPVVVENGGLNDELLDSLYVNNGGLDDTLLTSGNIQNSN